MVTESISDSIVERPTKEQLFIISEELNGDDSKTEDLKILVQQWIALDPSIPNNLNKTFVTNVIRLTKHNVERTKDKLKNYLIMKSYCKDIFFNRNPMSPEIERVMKTVNICISPKLTKECGRIFYFSLWNDNPDNFVVEDVLKYTFMIIDAATAIDTHTCGEVVIYDCKNVTLAHIPKLIRCFNLASEILLKAYPCRLKEVHVVNPLPVVEKVISLARNILPKKVKDKFYIHKDFKSLHEKIDPSLLTSTYDGELPSLSVMSEELNQRLRRFAPLFKEQESLKYLGPVTEKNNQSFAHLKDQIGVEGSFRKLDID
ncbi:alpha-tocopherol transfer protein-like [Aethina tumida]|uniref:alpha-tocopherol transfer protein-like n=1 Tax=Aethina tumida TaxID=116153 RepID=UPI00096AE81C|nr:alpha-tocopherol transfer protein-like [Aethina tumida]